MPDASKSRNAVSFKFLVPWLELQVFGVCVVLSCITPIILIIGLKLHALPCQLLAAGLLLVLLPHMLLPIVLLDLILVVGFSIYGYMWCWCGVLFISSRRINNAHLSRII